MDDKSTLLHSDSGLKTNKRQTTTWIILSKILSIKTHSNTQLNVWETWVRCLVMAEHFSQWENTLHMCSDIVLIESDIGGLCVSRSLNILWMQRKHKICDDLTMDHELI